MAEADAKQNRGIQFLMKCLDEAPDLISAVKNMGHPLTPNAKSTQKPNLTIETSIRSVQEPIKSLSGHAYSLTGRFANRPSSAPGPWTYFTMEAPREVKGVKFGSRVERSLEPRPESYLVSDPFSSRFGYLSREQKTQGPDETSLGPGFYKVNTSSLAKSGSTFPLEERNLKTANSAKGPGPGQYHTGSSSPSNAYSIAKSNIIPPFIRSQKVGPGSYNIPTPKSAEGHKFSLVPRFDGSYSDKIDCKAKAAFLVLTKINSKGQTEKPFLRRNLDISGYRPDMKSHKIKQRASLNATTGAVVRNTHRILQANAKQSRSSSLEQKFRRLEFRQNIEEVRTIGNCWLEVSIVLGFAFAWKRKADNKAVVYRQALSKRADKQLRWLMILSLTVGKMNLARKKRNFERTLRVRAILVIEKSSPTCEPMEAQS
jgi:hypothetical protein